MQTEMLILNSRYHCGKLEDIIRVDIINSTKRKGKIMNIKENFHIYLHKSKFTGRTRKTAETNYIFDIL
jgi:hypothetical protein